jgi:hypothetical protein
VRFSEFAPLMRRKGSLLKFHVAQRGHIYFIVCGNGICKIGASTNPVARIRDQISLNGELTLTFGEFSELSFAELVNPDTGLNSREAVAA